jgi:hypothetical protein
MANDYLADAESEYMAQRQKKLEEVKSGQNQNLMAVGLGGLLGGLLGGDMVAAADVTSEHLLDEAKSPDALKTIADQDKEFRSSLLSAKQKRDAAVLKTMGSGEKQYGTIQKLVHPKEGVMGVTTPQEARDYQAQGFRPYGEESNTDARDARDAARKANTDWTQKFKVGEAKSKELEKYRKEISDPYIDTQKALKNIEDMATSINPASNAMVPQAMARAAGHGKALSDYEQRVHQGSPDLANVAERIINRYTSKTPMTDADRVDFINYAREMSKRVKELKDREDRVAISTTKSTRGFDLGKNIAEYGSIAPTLSATAMTIPYIEALDATAKINKAHIDKSEYVDKKGRKYKVTKDKGVLKLIPVKVNRAQRILDFLKRD